VSVLLVLSKSIRALTPSAPTLLSVNVHHKQVQKTKVAINIPPRFSVVSAVSVLSALARASVPSSPTPLSTNVHHKQIQQTKAARAIPSRSNVVSDVFVLSASARALAPSSPMLFPVNVHHKHIQQTEAEKNTFKVQRREFFVGLERISEGLGTVSANVVPCERPPQIDSAN